MALQASDSPAIMPGSVARRHPSGLALGERLAHLVQVAQDLPGPAHHAPERIVGHLIRIRVRSEAAPPGPAAARRHRPARSRAPSGRPPAPAASPRSCRSRRPGWRSPSRRSPRGSPPGRPTTSAARPVFRSRPRTPIGWPSADRDLDLLGHALADQQVVALAHVGDDVLVHLVAGDPDPAAGDDAAQRDHGDLGGAAADVHDHRAGRFVRPAARRRSPPPSAPRSGTPRGPRR